MCLQLASQNKIFSGGGGVGVVGRARGWEGKGVRPGIESDCNRFS